MKYISNGELTIIIVLDKTIYFSFLGKVANEYPNNSLSCTRWFHQRRGVYEVDSWNRYHSGMEYHMSYQPHVAHYHWAISNDYLTNLV